MEGILLERFVKWLYGYLYVRIKGNSPERFINLCSARKIQIWNIKKTEKGYEFNISIDDFKRLPSIAKKTKTRPYIINRMGFPFLIKQIKPRKGLWTGGILFFVLLYVLSSYIWDIQISGQYTYTKEALIKYLRTIDVYSGMAKRNLSCPEVETAIREKYTDIGWVSAELRGTKLLIKIQETNMPSLYETDSTPRHLVASRSGVVDSIMTRTGTPLVKKGDVVEKGDILISGIVEIYGDSGEILKKEPVAADGDVVIKAETSYYDEVTKKYWRKEYTGIEKKSYGGSAFGYKVIPLISWDFQMIFDIADNWKKEILESGQMPEEKETKYDFWKENMEIYLNDTLKLPVKIERNSYKEYYLKEEKYTKEEMESILQKNFDYYIEKLIEKGVIINGNNVKIVISDTLGTMSGKITISEKADKFRKVSDDEWRMIETDEYSGNNN